jgi:hypothetical protein
MTTTKNTLVIMVLLILKITKAQEDIAFCIPDQIVYWDPQPLEDHVHQCLTTNFYWAAQNRTILKPYVFAYIKAYNISRHADQDDDNLFYKKRTFMTTLRDTQLKVTHHMHAIHKCASIAHKMPTRLMSAYTNEAEMMFTVGKLWSHHIKQDLGHCERVLFDVVKRQHLHLHGHIMYDLHEYSKARDIVRIRREDFIEQANQVKLERIHLMDFLSGKTDIPPGTNRTFQNYTENNNGTVANNGTFVNGTLVNGTFVNGTVSNNGTFVNSTVSNNGTFVNSTVSNNGTFANSSIANDTFVNSTVSNNGTFANSSIANSSNILNGSVTNNTF